MARPQSRQDMIDELKVKIAAMRAERGGAIVREATLLSDGRVLVTVAPPPHLRLMEARD